MLGRVIAVLDGTGQNQERKVISKEMLAQDRISSATITLKGRRSSGITNGAMVNVPGVMGKRLAMHSGSRTSETINTGIADLFMTGAIVPKKNVKKIEALASSNNYAH